MHPNRAHLLRSIAAVSIAALALAGCSMMPRLLYQQADWLLLREMDDYLDLREGQREHVALALEAQLSRHRVGHLPGIATVLSEAAFRAQRGFDEEDAHWALQQGRVLLAESVELLLPTVVSALADLTPEQRQHLARRMAERENEYAERHALESAPEERLRRTTKRTVRRIEQWTGPLSPEQIDVVREASRTMPETAPLWLAYSRERHKALLALLHAGATPTAIGAFLREWWIRRDVLPPALAHSREQRIEAYIRLIVRLDAALNSVQRAHLVGRLQDLADDARSLVRAA